MSFVFVSGRPILDFVGTLKWRRSAQPDEQLTGAAELGDWAAAAGLVTEPITVTGDELARAIAVREAAYRVVGLRRNDQRAGRVDVELLNRAAGQLPLTARLLTSGRVRRDGSAEQLLATLALDTFDLLAGPDLDRVRECANPDCTRLYVDTSRGHNRRWCGMAECGNRAKAEAFRHRRKAAAS